MARYDQTFAVGATLASDKAVARMKATIATARLEGAHDEAILQMLLRDVDEGGPVFGEFLDDLGAAATKSVGAAAAQGEVVGRALEDATLRRLLARNEVDVDRVIEEADAETADAIEDAVADQLVEVWVCAMRNTCPFCLVMHGEVRTRRQWRESGVMPGTIHSMKGFKSNCQCRLMQVDGSFDRSKLMAPLVRVKVEKGQSRTKRAVLTSDFERAERERAKAMESEEGRRTLRQLGQALSEE